MVQPKRRAGSIEGRTLRIVEHSGVDDVAGVPPLASDIDAAVRDEATPRVAVELTEDAEAALAEAERDGGGRVPDEEVDRLSGGTGSRGVRVVEEEAAVVDAAGAGVRGHRRAHRPRLFG